MPRDVTCPTCKHTLRVPAGTADRWLTCPRCLASVGNPNVLLTTETPAPSASEPAPEEATCPGCGREVDPGWRVCPVCEEPLRRRRVRLPRTSEVDEEVRGDSRGVGIVLIVLGLLGACGIVLFLCGGGLNNLQPGQGKGVIGAAFFAGVVLLGLVIAGMVVSATARQAAGRILGIGLGAAALAVIIVVLILTGFLYSIASCLEGCQGNRATPPPPPPKVAPKQ